MSTTDSKSGINEGAGKQVDVGVVVNQNGDSVIRQRVNNTAEAVVTPTGASALTANSSTSYTFPWQAHHWFIENKSNYPVYWMTDAAASLGSGVVPAAVNGVPGIFGYDSPCTVMQLYSTNATAVNGVADGNIVLMGWT